MRLRTQLIIGLTVVLLGVGVLSLGLVEQESNVRQVVDVLAAPDAHDAGDYVLVGIPQPEQLTSFGNGGEAVAQEPNPRHSNTTVHHTTWTAGDGTPRVATHTLTVTGPDADGTTHWSLRNETRQPGVGLVADPTWSHWTVEGPHIVVLIEGFPDEAGVSPALFGVYHGVLRDPLQPKPSQFEGRLATHAGGVALPDGAVVFEVDEYTAGCSSKFIPEDHREEYADDAEGTEYAEAEYAEGAGDASA